MEPHTISQSRTRLLLEEEVANFTSFTGAETPKPNSVFIAVMGATGAGKSSFIKAASGRDDIDIGHDLSSCTSSITIFHFKLNEYNIYLVDTPGFDDTNRPDLELLKTLSNFFSVAYTNRNLFNGVIYMHRITDTRMTRSSKRNIEMFKALCGKSAYPNVAMLTTMWASDVYSLEYTKELEREEQLKTDYFSDILADDGLMFRIRSESASSIDQSSARSVFAELFESWKNDKITLTIQHELVNKPYATLDETAAGKMLLLHLAGSAKSYESQLSDIRSSLNEPVADSRDSTSALVEQRRDIKQCLDNIRRDQQSMQLTLVQIHMQERDRFVREIERLEQRWKDEMREKEREQQRQAQDLINYLRVNENQRRWQNQEERSIRQQNDAELQRMRMEMKAMREETEARLNATQKAKNAWVGPLVKGLASGGLGLAGTLITGALCVIQ